MSTSHSTTSSSFILKITFFLFLALQFYLLIVGIWNVPMHWDEGWNLCVARTWFEDGHYGCKILGKFTTARLSTGWFPVAFTRLGFELTGVHYTGGRIPNGIFLIIALLGVFFLTKSLYRSTLTASLAVVIALSLTPDTRLNPILLSNQAFSEIIAVAFLIWAIFLYNRVTSSSKALSTTFIHILLAGILLSFSFKTKYLALPFAYTGLTITGLLLFTQKRYREGLVTFSLILATYISYKYLNIFYYPVTDQEIVRAGAGTEGLFQALAINLDIDLRLRIVNYLIRWYWWLLLLLGALITTILESPRDFLKSISAGNLALGTIIVLWSGWFFFLSIDFPRYYAIPSILLSIYLADFLIKHIPNLQSSKFTSKLSAYLIFTFISLQLIFTPIHLSSFIFSHTDENISYFKTAEFLNSHIDPTKNEFVETYETPLFHLLNVPYHYPPDQINVQSIYHHTNKSFIRKNYDYLAIDPFCIVNGEWSKTVYTLYIDIENNDDYKLELTDNILSTYCKITRERNEN